MIQLLLTILILFQPNTFGQSHNTPVDFHYKVMEVEGDLNKDNLIDKVVITQDTLNANAPYKLEVFFKEPSGNYNLIVASTKIIEPKFPNGRDGFKSGKNFSDVTIKSGVLNVSFELLRGHYEHKFRFQNGNFELIGFSMVSSNGIGVMTTIDFNLSTGIRIETKERYDTDKLLEKSKKKIWIRPLPKLQDVVPMETGLY